MPGASWWCLSRNFNGRSRDPPENMLLLLSQIRDLQHRYLPSINLECTTHSYSDPSSLNLSDHTPKHIWWRSAPSRHPVSLECVTLCFPLPETDFVFAYDFFQSFLSFQVLPGAPLGIFYVSRVMGHKGQPDANRILLTLPKRLRQMDAQAREFLLRKSWMSKQISMLSIRKCAQRWKEVSQAPLLTRNTLRLCTLIESGELQEVRTWWHCSSRERISSLLTRYYTAPPSLSLRLAVA